MTEARGTITEKQLASISDLESERDTGLNRNGNKVAWTVTKEATLAELIAKRDAPWAPSETLRKHIVDVYVRNVYNRFTEINAKQLKKGNDTEEDSITTISLRTGHFMRKNEEQLRNDFIMGTPDLFMGESILKANVIRDAKSSWDVFTFNRSIHSELLPMYYWQMQGYMDLTGAQEAYVDYCLNNTPFSMVDRELYMESFKHEDRNTPTWIEMQIIANHVYDQKTFDEYLNRRGISAMDENCLAVYQGFVEIPLAERHFSFHVPRNQEDIDRLHDQILLCRKWMNDNLFKVELKQLKAA
jgi:hypothetical protein